MRSGSLTRVIIALFSATALLLCGVFAVLLVSVVNLRDDDSAAGRASDLLAQSFAVERSAVDLETGLRGFLLTRQASFLEPFAQARQRLPAQFASLRELARGRGQERTVGEIATAVSNYVNRYAQPVLATGGRLSPAEMVQVTSQDKQLLDGLRTKFDVFDASQLALRRSQRHSANSGGTLVLLMAVIGLVASLLLLAAQRIYLVLRIMRPIRAVGEAAQRLARGDMDVRVPKVGVGEVAMLGESFNAMAQAIQSRDAELSTARERLEQAVEEAREASEMKSNFLANMSHEIRTPLNGVIGMMNLLAETELRGEQREYVDAARSSGDALMTVVNDILDIAKIEAGRLELERRDFDLHDMVESTCDMVAANAVAKGLELQSFVHDDVPRAVRGDRTRVSQILANLLSNAVKFTAGGEVGVEVGVARNTGTVLETQFEVRDTGIGISPEKIDQLFEPFAQAEAGTTRKFGGTGLGLTIALELTRLMGGSIEAESEVGKGSVFRFTIPFEPAHAQLPTPVPAAGLRGLHVLVVDDSATNRRVFEAYLASWGMRPDVAHDADQATARLHAAARKGDPFDLALLDFNMPGESGVALAKRINASGVLGRTRLILLTSSGQTQADEPDTGIRCRLTKPIRQSRLLDAISLAMASEGPHRERREERAAADGSARTDTGAGRRLLVAEDQEVNWMLIERMLAKRGHQAVNTTDGPSTIDALAAGHYDLVLMDCQMPVIDGYDATREIRRREKAENRRRVSIVAMTANAMLGDRERCIAAGMDDYIAKPISGEALDSVLNRWLPSEQLVATPLSGDRLGELRSLFSEEEMNKLLSDLVADVSTQLERIETALGRDDRATVAHSAHRITNSARMVGAEPLAEAAIRLDRLADEDPRDDAAAISDAAQALRDRWQDVRAAIAGELVR